MAGPRSSQIYPYISYGRPRIQPYSETVTTGSLAAETAARIAADNTLQSNINLKADIASPTFTGDPKAPTPVTADNDTSIATTAYVQAQGYATTVSVTTADNLRVLKAGDTMTGDLIVNPGNVGIGTVAPQVKFQVRGSSPNLAITDQAAAANNQTWDWFLNGGGMSGRAVNDAYNAANNWVQVSRSGTTITNTAFPQGTTSNVSGAWVVISGRDMKQDIEPYERGLEAIIKLNPVKFKYRAGVYSEEEASAPLFGLIADEVKPIVPEIVSNTKMMLMDKSIEIDTLAPGNLVFALINAVKELTARVTALEEAQ